MCSPLRSGFPRPRTPVDPAALAQAAGRDGGREGLRQPGDERAAGEMLDRMLAAHLPQDERIVGVLEHSARAHDLQRVRAMVRALRAQPFFSQSESTARIPHWRGLMRKAGARSGLVVEDSLGLLADSGNGHFLIVASLLRSELSTSRRERRGWLPVSQHLGAALRLRERLGLLPSREADPFRAARAEAIFDSSGRLLDARSVAKERPARSALRDAVVGMERARRERGLENAERALCLWQALVAGRWSLVERFDTDGRRLLVAYRNDIEVPDLRALGSREAEAVRLLSEGHSSKEIAARFGASQAAVSQCLHRAARKLGLSSLGELTAVACSIERSDGYRLPTASDANATAAEAAECAQPDVPDMLEEDEWLHVLSSPHPGASGSLSDSERKVVQLILSGLPRAEVARRRGVALPTVHNQLASAYRKLGVTSRQELLSARAGRGARA